MAKIGFIRPEDGNGTECLRGHISTLNLDFCFRLVPTGAPANSNQPSHRLYVKKLEDMEVEIGAAWKRPMRTSTGHTDMFLSITIDDPSFERPVNVAAFPTKEPGHYDISWRRHHDRNANSDQR